MKRLFAVLLALVMIVSALPALAEKTGLPLAGDVVYGFEVKEIRDFPLIGAELVLFEHQKTGAKLLWIANDDTNRAFELSFPTRPSDNTGLPHVLEHACMFGSKKYPSTTMYFNVSYQTYNTYLNAHTTDAMNGFPVGSLSEKQLLSLADYYVDSCFHPLILTEKSIFDTQAWHYNLSDLDGEMTYEGVVYSEMLGLEDLASAALHFSNELTFPGAYLSYNQGGMPESIPDMTWEDVKSFHEKFYHPSNCLAILYGQFEDYTAFLALLDAEFSQYEKAEFILDDPGYTPITEPVTASMGYPVAEGTDVTNQSVIYYDILCPGMKGDTEQETLVTHLCALLNENASVLSQSFKKAFPAGSLSCGREVAGPDDAIRFCAVGMNEGDAEQLKALVDEALKNVAENGFPQDMVDAAMTGLNISTKLAPESSNPIAGVIMNTVYVYAVTGNPFDYAEKVAALSAIDEENQQGLLKDAAARWLADASLYTLTTTYPAPGEKEKQDEALKEKLAAIKAGMTQEELQAIVDATNAEPKEEDNAELIAKLKAVTVASLPEEIKTYSVSDFTDENGIRHIEVPAGVDGIGSVSILLDAAALPQEDIHWMRLYTRLLGQLDTAVHTREELDLLIARYLYDKMTGVQIVDREDGVHPYLAAKWKALDEDLAAGYDLMYELLFQTRFDDVQRLTELVSAQKTSVRADINQNADYLILSRGFAGSDPSYRYYNYLNYLDYYAYLEDLEAQLSENPEEVVRHFQTIQAFFANNAGAIATFAGNEQSIELNRPLADAFLARLDTRVQEPMEYDLPVPARWEAVIIDGNIQYNSVIASAENMGLEGYDAGLRAIANLVGDQLLVPLLRDQLGVYTPVIDVTEKGALYMLSYLDPNVKETFDVYASLGDRIAQMEVDQDTLDGYIMSVYAILAKPEGELSGAESAIESTLSGKKMDRVLDYLRQLKAVTPETVKAAADIYAKAWENGMHSTAGNAAAINAAADLYDVILNPFNAKDFTQVELTDAAEGSEHYEAVRFVFENSLIASKSEDAFGVDEPAVAGDLYAALYVLIGGAPNAPEEAMAYLAQFGLVPDGLQPDTVLTNGMSDEIFVAFGGAIGLELTADEPNETTDQPISRGMLAEAVYMLAGYLQ